MHMLYNNNTLPPQRLVFFCAQDVRDFWAFQAGFLEDATWQQMLVAEILQ